jgi:hypothetical protein
MLFEIHPACPQYRPNWDKWEKEGQLCTGFGASPDCLACGQDEMAHRYVGQPSEQATS